jgi:hypothetical protein
VRRSLIAPGRVGSHQPKLSCPGRPVGPWSIKPSRRRSWRTPSRCCWRGDLVHSGPSVGAHSVLPPGGGGVVISLVQAHPSALIARVSSPGWVAGCCWSVSGPSVGAHCVVLSAWCGRVSGVRPIRRRSWPGSSSPGRWLLVRSPYAHPSARTGFSFLAGGRLLLVGVRPIRRRSCRTPSGGGGLLVWLVQAHPSALIARVLLSWSLGTGPVALRPSVGTHLVFPFCLVRSQVCRLRPIRRRAFAFSFLLAVSAAIGLRPIRRRSLPGSSSP